MKNWQKPPAKMTKSGNFRFSNFCANFDFKIGLFYVVFRVKIDHFRFQIVEIFENFEVLDMTRVIRVIHDYTMRQLGPFPSSIFHPVRNPSHDEISNLDFYQSRLDVKKINIELIFLIFEFFIVILTLTVMLKE